MVVLTFFTAGLLRQFHESTPHSPYVPPVVGSLLFAGIFFLLLVSAREWRRGAVPGPGVRLGSVTPLLLMLLIEKWISLALYNPVFYFLAHEATREAILDAQFRLFAGVGLLAVCLLVGRLSAPTARKTWRRARPARFFPAALIVAVVIGVTYLVVAGLSLALGAGARLQWPEVTPLLFWVLGGQAILAFAEEVYYRGLVLSEIERLAPRLGARRPAARRWIALIASATLFAMEHLRITTAFDVMGRQFVFTLALGVLLGLLVMLSTNLHFVGGLHAWINWLLLGAAPRFVTAEGRPALPSGLYIGVMLLSAFAMALVLQRLVRRRGGRRESAPPPTGSPA
jgi:membrane protease YdiL (CAAX protease family)